MTPKQKARMRLRVVGHMCPHGKLKEPVKTKSGYRLCSKKRGRPKGSKDKKKRKSRKKKSSSPKKKAVRRSRRQRKKPKRLIEEM
ncbi:MAG: hypothetical protein K0U52_00830 [Gammaproteobacteria bacterium]|nr:hypothetical protein [Gammaproteobacteria bacterium]